jgi:hypothetical protein
MSATPAGESRDAGFEPFDLTISLGPGSVPWISAASRLGHVHGIPRRDSEVPPLADLLDSVYDYVDAVRFAEREPTPLLTTALGQVVFGEPSVLELFQATRGAAGDRGRELLVRILASPHFAVLPWELLPDPARRHSEDEGRFLALSPDASVVRLARGRTYPVRSARLEPPLNLLVVLSSPTDDDDSLTFDIYEERRSLLAELAPLEDDGLLCVDVVDQPTLENLRRKIGAQRRGYHLFHYLGHAEPDRLILENEYGRRDDQSGSRFTDILRLCPDLRLAVFAGCETARAAGDPLTIDTAAARGQSLLSLSDRCVQECSPVVVGMQAVLPFRTERLFTRFFYQGLVSGHSVAAAVRLARGATRGDRHVGGELLDWSVPVLFVGGSEPSPLVDPATPGVPPKRPPRPVLRLGMSQDETRFFARDAALRQSVDILTGAAPERVLVITGPSGVGKTKLFDRALEEIPGPAAILYVDFKEIAPALRGQPEAMCGPNWRPGLDALRKLDPEAPLGEVCKLSTELMARGGGDRTASEPGWGPRQWWPRIMEDLSARRFVLVIDGLDALVALEDALTDRILTAWLVRRMEAARAARDAAITPLHTLLDGLIVHVREGPGFTQRPGTPANIFIRSLPELAGWLGGYRATTRTCLAVAAQHMLRALRHGEPVEALAERLRDQAGTDADLDDLRSGFERLGGIRQALDEALRMVAERRSGLRLAVGASEMPEGLLDLPTDQRFVMRLGRLTWSETWRWVRRNLPGLLRYGEEHLERIWPRLGSELERWEELERRVLAYRPPTPDAPKEPDVEALLDEIAPRSGGRGSDDRRRARVSGGLDIAPRGERSLRVAVAGPHIVDPDALARGVTRLAADHGIGGRVVTTNGPGSGSLAVLIDVPSPLKTGHATEEDVLRWLRQVTAQEPDIVLLDYGHRVPIPFPDSAEQDFLRSLRHECLMIAAGGNKDGEPGATAPGVYPEVLAVGPLADDGSLQSYAEWAPELKSGKPDLFMRDQLLGTPLQDCLDESVLGDMGFGPGTHGSSFSALQAVVAAILVWSTIPDFTPAEVRGLMVRAAQSVGAKRSRAPMRLEVSDAVAAAREEVVKRTLAKGPCSLQSLSAITGLDARIVSASLQALIPKTVRRLTRGRLERYELIGAR